MSLENSVAFGREAQLVGKAAETRFAQAIIDVLKAERVSWYEIVMSGRLDCGEKIDLRVIWDSASSRKVLDFQISTSPKTKNKQERLEKRGIIPVVVSPSCLDEKVREIAYMYLFPDVSPREHGRYRAVQ